MKHLTDVVIVGAGVIGCSIAYALRKQGIDVVVLDKNEVGAQASQAASGMLAPLKPFADPGDPYTQLLLASLARFPELVPELEDASGMCLAYQSTGTLRVMQTKRLSRLRAWVSTWRHQGFPVELLSDDEIRHYEPGLATDISLVLYNPHDPQLDAVQLVRAYACAAERLGAMFYTHEEVNAVDHHHERILGVRTSQGKTIACTYLVLATGAWAAQSDWLGITLPVSPPGSKHCRAAACSCSPTHGLWCRHLSCSQERQYHHYRCGERRGGV
jgi:glycine oxidase